jgi:signal transduction histidine kinase
MMRLSSIASRLIAAVLLVEFTAAAVVVLLALGYERHSHFRSFDIMVRGRADSVLGAVQDAEDVGDNVMLDLADLHVPPEDVYEVWDGRGHLLGRSENWPGSASVHVPDHNGFFRSEVNQRHYRLLRLAGSRIIDPGETGGGKLRFVTILYGSPIEHVLRSIYGAVEFYIAGMLLLILITGPLIAWVLHRGLAPLRELAMLAGNVSAESWSFNPPASARETAELRPMTHAIENVLQRLQLSFNQQRTFVSDAAHELKTAVAVVKSSLQLTGMKPRTLQEYQAGNQRALADTERIEELVGRMLALARLENGSVASVSAACSIHQCISGTVSELEPFATIRRVEVVVQSIPSDACMLPLVPDDCQLVFNNLVLNAIQHSPPNSQVKVRASVQSDWVEVIIQDHGEGIDPDDLPHVFERFYRADPSRARSTGGTGLGLAICKAAVEKAGGSISISSDLGKGTAATVRLPIISQQS